MKVTPNNHQVRKINYLCDIIILFSIILSIKKKVLKIMIIVNLLFEMQRKHHKIKIILLVI